MDKTYQELLGFDATRLQRLSHYNRMIQEHANVSDGDMAENFCVTEKSYVKNIKYHGPAASAIKYAVLHYKYGVCLDRYLADDIGFCEEEICGYKDFVFSTTEHTMVTPSAVNKAIAKIIKSYNAKETAEAEAEGREPFLLPHFTAHVLRHTFCTRLCEAGVNPKFIQSVIRRK